jgi:hypothetical protein
MRTIQELAAAAAITDTSTTQISEFQGTQWSSELIKFGESQREFSTIAIMNYWLVGKGDNTLTLPVTTSALDIDISPTDGEGGARDNTEMTNMDTASLTVAASDFHMGKHSISKQILLSSRVDLMKQARYNLSQYISRKLDEDIATTLQEASTITQVLWGGDATGVDSLAAGDVLTTDLISNARAQIEQHGFVPTDFFIGVNQLNALRKDPQFVNAAEFGDASVVRTGEIVKYLGITIHSTINASMAYAGSATDVNETPTAWAVAGNCGVMVGRSRDKSNIAVAVAWKEKPNIGYEFKPDEALHNLYLNQAYKIGLVQPKAVCLVKVSNA